MKPIFSWTALTSSKPRVLMIVFREWEVICHRFSILDLRYVSRGRYEDGLGKCKQLLSKSLWRTFLRFELRTIIVPYSLPLRFLIFLTRILLIIFNLMISVEIGETRFIDILDKSYNRPQSCLTLGESKVGMIVFRE